jgi:Undecaprenyl-phosphate glucose phosphotransferase
MDAAVSTSDVGLKVQRKRGGSRAGSRLERTLRRPRKAVDRLRFSLFAALIDGLGASMSVILVGLLYNFAVYHVVGVATAFTSFTVMSAVLFVIFNVFRNEYELFNYLTFAGHARRILLVWNVAFLTSFVLIFIVREINDLSRGAMILSYGLGLMAVTGLRAVVAGRVKAGAVTGDVSATRIVLFGYEENIQEFIARYAPWTCGVDIVASFALRSTDTLNDDLALAAASARVLAPDDIHILVPWTETATVEACVNAFGRVPASIHLGPQPVLDRYSSLYVSRIGKVYSLQIVPRPLTVFDVIIKRLFDLLLVVPMILVALPIFLVIALAIKLDSQGPVVFRQRRYGFNQKMFSIFKFRSMRVTEDGRTVQQATSNDPRVTRVGRIIRRFNLDELPQLFNVLRGEMSLVGPRPHALAHNQHYERIIADYARRHNVKPGITGWAQIHGLRGEVTSNDVMQQRLEHDLYYIDNWTIGLDLRILALTLLTPKAFTNAY